MAPDEQLERTVMPNRWRGARHSIMGLLRGGPCTARGVVRRFVFITFVAAVPLCGNAADLPKCEANLMPQDLSFLPLVPPRTEYNPQGSVVVLFTVNPDGTVSDVSFRDWAIRPADDFMRLYLSRSVKSWRFPNREGACGGQRKITIELARGA